MQRFRTLFPGRAPLIRRDYETYLGTIPRWREVMQTYDLVHAYCLDPILPVLAGLPNFCAYEHGTLRSIPFEDSSRGRLAALSYMEAPAVFVTNTDVVSAAVTLGIPPERIVRLPHAVDSRRLLAFAEEHEALRPGLSTPVTLFSPSRQDWVDRDPSWTKGNDIAIRGLRLAVDQGADCRLLLGAWGRDLEASRALIRELDLVAHVEWLPPLRKRRLWEGFLRSHAVLDQFGLPAIGGVTFEALAMGCRVITALDEIAAADFFGAPPPLFSCTDPASIATAMLAITDDPFDERGVGRAARDWFAQYHSTDRILTLEVEAYARIVDGGTHAHIDG
jgi:glycosyltransferase involved in cell wall biosynthesis